MPIPVQRQIKGRILVVEDEADIRELIELHLLRDGHRVQTASDGEEALRLLTAASGSAEPGFDLVILDWMLPGLSGLEVARGLRASPDDQLRVIPLLMVTARAEGADIVLGLESGADDYVTKPFESPVLLARVRALLRRGERLRAAPLLSPHSAPTPTVPSRDGAPMELRLGQLKIRRDRHEVLCGTDPVELTPSEFKLLVTLVEGQGKVLTREQIIMAVQGEGVTVVDRAVDTHVFGLRKKMGACADLIETVRGIGYRIRIEE